LRTIEVELNEFYKRYPEVYSTKHLQIEGAIYEIRRAYWSNAFPEMNVDFRTYADNIGHTNSPGCFRCHDGKHVNKDGRTIRQECGLCHTVPTVVK